MEAVMSKKDPEFIKCAMDAVEQGIKAQEIKEECACRLGRPSQEETINPQPKE
jgi:hypothetical protein